jgi:lipoprotein-anchoring transpeptidase ErfK/SrfK
MMSRFRRYALALGAGIAMAGAAAPASAQGLSQFGNWGEAPERSASPSFLGVAPPNAAALAQGGGRPDISPSAPQTMAFQNGMAPGSIVIDTAGRKLYYTLSQGSAYVYPIAVGKQGFSWSGVQKVSKIVDWPDWIPPAEMRQRMPSLPVRMTGGLRNPLGAKAIYLGNTLYRIHGTNDAKTIGSASSSGCFRMHNGHVVHLAGMVSASTTVYVMRRLPQRRVMPPGHAPVAKAPEAAAPQPPPAAAQPENPAQAAPPAPPQSPPGEAAPPAEPADQGI